MTDSILELVHTSAPCGLLDPAGGYTTVACTEGMPPTLVARLERASSGATPRYRSDVPLDDLSVIRIWPLDMDGAWIVLTRVVPVPADFTGRPARLTHHVLLPRAAANGGHVRTLLERANTFRDRWDGAPQMLPRRSIPQATAQRPASSAIRSISHDPQAWLQRVSALAQLRGGMPSAVAVPGGVSRRQVIAEVCGRLKSVDRLRIASTAEPFDGQIAAVVVIGTDDALPTAMQWIQDFAVGHSNRSDPVESGAPASTTRRDPTGFDLAGLPTPPSVGVAAVAEPLQGDDESDDDAEDDAPRGAWWSGLADVGLIDARTIALLTFTIGIVVGSALTLLVAALFN